MNTRHRPRLFLAAAAMLALVPTLDGRQDPAAQPPAVQGPTFKAGVDLIRLDVTVVGKDGTPVADLAADDFEVLVDGRPAPIVTSRYLSLQSRDLPDTSGTSLAATRDFTGNDSAAPGRLFVLVVDHESLPTGAGRPLMMSAVKLLNRMSSTDRVALIALPQPGQRVEFTDDIDDVKRSLSKITGRRQARVRTVRINFEEAQAFEARNQIVIDSVYDRECRSRSIDATCMEQLREEAADVLQETRQRSLTTLSHLSGLFDSLTGIEGPKTVVFFSAGVGFEASSLHRFREVARRAIEARAMLYIAQVDTFLFDTSERASSAAFMGDYDSGGIGLGTLTGMTGGVLLKAVGTGDEVWRRVERESSGLYVLGVEPPTGMVPTEPLKLQVRVKRTGLTVRSPQQVVPPAALPVWPDQKRALGFTLRQPRPATELPLRVAAYTLRGSDSLRLKTIIAADLALPLGQSADLAWGFEVLDKGRVIADAFDHGLPQGSTETPDGVMLVTSVSLPAGRYTLRFAAIDAAGRRGSVDHPIAVGLRMTHEVSTAAASPERLYFSDLLVGQDVGTRFQPRLELAASGGELSALLELYGGQESGIGKSAVEFDVRGLDGATRVATRVTPSVAEGDFRRVAVGRLPVDRLRPGAYELHAKVLVEGRAVGAVRRQITVVGGP
jgi:VWFA-related protein